jgi:hypothetical protein
MAYPGLNDMNDALKAGRGPVSTPGRCNLMGFLGSFKAMAV